VVDDDEQGITDVVRGADLIDSTARQMHLQRLLGLRRPSYLHLPVALNAAGQKLSKQTGAAAIDLQRGHAVLAQALAFLGQAPSTGLQQAIEQWDPARIPRRRAMPLTGRAAGSP
jgi:glutamyl-Q tRNA(Asp) synthetase